MSSVKSKLRLRSLVTLVLRQGIVVEQMAQRAYFARCGLCQSTHSAVTAATARTGVQHLTSCAYSLADLTRGELRHVA